MNSAHTISYHHHLRPPQHRSYAFVVVCLFVSAEWLKIVDESIYEFVEGVSL